MVLGLGRGSIVTHIRTLMRKMLFVNMRAPMCKMMCVILTAYEADLLAINGQATLMKNAHFR